MRTEKATKKITASGDSLVINVTSEVKRLGLGRGDLVDISLSSADGDLKQLIYSITENAIKTLGLKTTIGGYIATPDQVNRIAQSVGDCLPSKCRVVVFPNEEGFRGALYLEIDIVYDDLVGRMRRWAYVVDFYQEDA